MCNVTTNHQAKEKYEYGSMASIVDTSDSNTGNAIEHIHNNENFMQREDGDEFHFVSYCCAVFHSLSKHRIIYSIFFGQVLALLLATSAAANSTLYNDCEVSLPTAQTFLVYFCLFLLHAPSLCLQQSEVFDCLSPKWYHFLLPSLLDVEANYLCVLALRYSTLTSVTILDAFAIPSSMFFSKILSVRKESFGSHHYVGVMICSLGLCMTVLSDGFIQENEVNKGNNPLLGDALALLGGIFYGLNDTIAEKFVKDYDREKYLGFLGLFGGIISLAQITFIEMDQFDVFINGNSLCSSYHVGGLVLSAVIPNSLFYIGVSLFLSKLSDASMLNLSLLTSDLWAMAFSMFYQKFIPTYFYFIALIVIVVGVTTFEAGHMFL